MKKIIVLFKTHLDIGFTDTAEKVTENYMLHYLPNAMRVAREMRGEQERFVWTTGSWLIDKFLKESPDRELLEEAIREGEVRWHGLPFTTHTELMDNGLLSYGLGIGRKLDQRFGLETKAAKLTDVPGHTKAMIPYLAEAGIQFLHIGINPASTRPQVPDLFWWKAESGEKILVMYNNDYGELTSIGNSGTAVYFAHTGDNSGPQDASQVREVYRNLHEQYPEAELYAGTLEDVAKEALLLENLPVIEEEIGDTWIHGGGTDPRKLSQFRGLLRLEKQLDKKDMEAIYQELLLVPEHTWGLDEKTWLGNTKELGYLQGEHITFLKEEFLEARETEKFRRMESSWKEQRDYVERGAKAVPQRMALATQQIMTEYRREPWNVDGYVKVYEHVNSDLERDGNDEIVTALEISGYHVSIDDHGAVCGLRKGDMILADNNHLLGAFYYEVFSNQEYEQFKKQYVVTEEIWAIEDFSKIGMEKAITQYHEYLPAVQEIYRRENTLVICMKLPEEAVLKYGGMESLEMVIQLEEEQVIFDFAWWGKEPTRVAEGSWLAFCPSERVSKLHKINTWISPNQVVRCGNRRMHGVNQGVRFQSIELKTIDAPLVSIGERSLLKFSDTLPDLEKGIYCNLHNNVWGTNFPMWYEDDARFRFCISRIC